MYSSHFMLSFSVSPRQIEDCSNYSQSCQPRALWVGYFTMELPYELFHCRSFIFLWSYKSLCSYFFHIACILYPILWDFSYFSYINNDISVTPSVLLRWSLLGERNSPFQQVNIFCKIGFNNDIILHTSTTLPCENKKVFEGMIFYVIFYVIYKKEMEITSIVKSQNDKNMETILISNCRRKVTWSNHQVCL